MPRLAATREHATRDRQAVVCAGLHHAQTADGVVATQNHHLDALHAVGVKAQQLLRQRKSHARLGWLFEFLLLQAHISAVIALLEHFVFVFKIKQGAGRNGNDELAV